MNKQLEMVFANYPLKSSKLCDLYYKEPHIKRLVRIMVRALDNQEAKKMIIDTLWLIEDISRSDFNLMVNASQSGKLQNMFSLIDWIGKERLD